MDISMANYVKIIIKQKTGHNIYIFFNIHIKLCSMGSSKMQIFETIAN